jgi:DNA-binding IclR family transcriptional regulator
MQTKRDNRSGVQSVEIAIRVLQVLVSAGHPLNLKEFSTLCRMNPSKLHRYLVSFVTTGMIAQTRRAGEYDLGKLAVEIGLAAIQRIDLANYAADHLDDLVSKTGVPASLSVWSPHGPTTVRWQRAPQPINTAFSIGSLLPLLSSATGNVFLAYMPASVTGPIVANETAASGEEANLNEIVNSVREKGYAMSRGTFIPGLTGISAPILDERKEIQAAVTIITRISEAREQAMVEAILAFTAGCSPRPIG